MTRFALLIAIPLVLFGTLPAAAKKFDPNDRSSNNSCSYVYSWFKKTKEKHAVFVTTGGAHPFKQKTSAYYCQAGAGDTLKGAIDYAISRCNRASAKKYKKPKRCKVVESR